MSIKEEFEMSTKLVENFKKRPTDEELLKLYALYKQSKFGNCNIEEPSRIYVKDHAKWKAWNDRKGLKQEKAMAKYSDFALKLSDKYS